jgi:hypothetical protein
MLKRDEQGRENYCFYGLCALSASHYYYKAAERKGMKNTCIRRNIEIYEIIR